MTRADVPDAVVTELLTQMYTPAALEYMRHVYHAWDPHADAKLFADIEVPLHPAALKFYQAHGMLK